MTKINEITWTSKKTSLKAIITATCEHMTEQEIYADGDNVTVKIDEIKKSLKIEIFADNKKVETATHIGTKPSLRDKKLGAIASIGRVLFTDSEIVNKLQTAVSETEKEAFAPYAEVIERKAEEEKVRLADLAEYEKHNNAVKAMMNY